MRSPSYIDHEGKSSGLAGFPKFWNVLQVSLKGVLNVRRAVCRGLQRRPYNLSNAMRKRYLFWSGLALMAILLTLVVWQVSFTFGEYGPANVLQTFVFWAVSTLIFLLTVTLGFMLFRTFVNLILEPLANCEA